MIPASRIDDGAVKLQVFAMFKTLTVTVLLLTSTWALAAKEEHTFELWANIPLPRFQVRPVWSDWIGLPQRLSWNKSTSTLDGLSKDFYVLNQAGAVSARLLGEAYLSNGKDRIELSVTFNGKLLNVLTSQEVVSSQEARRGKVVSLEIAPQKPRQGYMEGSYSGAVKLMFNAVAP